MKTILNLISDTNIGGAGRVLLNYIPYSDKEKFHTQVALPRGSLLKQPLLQIGAEVFEVDAMADRSFSLSDVRRLKALLREKKPDLVHTHGALSGRIAAKQCGLPVVYTRHSVFDVPKKLRRPPGRWLNHWINEHYADHIIAVSPAARQNLVEAGVNPKKITTMMNGVIPLTRTSPDEQHALRASLGLSDEIFLFGILARLEHYKGHLTILQAVQQLVGQGLSDFCVLIAGTGEFEAEIKAQIEALGLSQQVKMLGFRSDVRELLSILDVQLNASYGTETSSLSLLEGMSMSLPAIASDYGGNPEVIFPPRNGLLYPTRKAEALADCMRQLMCEPALLQQMRHTTRSVYEQRFTAEVFARNVEKVYHDILKGRS